MDSNDILNNKNDDLNSIKSKASLDNKKAIISFQRYLRIQKKIKHLKLLNLIKNYRKY